MSAPTVQPEYFAKPATEVAKRFDVDPSQGLDDATVTERRSKFGANYLPESKQKSWWRLLADQFASVLVLLLLAAAVASLITGDPLEAAAIMMVLLLNAGVGFTIELRAQKAISTLHKLTKTTATVRRSGIEQQVDATDLVPGDIIVLDAGDRIPADARLTRAKLVRVDEAALTGESLPVEKSSDAVDSTASLPDRTSMVHLGTPIVGGHAEAIVTEIGIDTQLGRIGSMVAEVESEETPLERRLAVLGKRLVLLVIAIALIVFAVGVLRGVGLLEMAKVSISLAVAAIPEGLPAVTTLVLALGVLRMSRRHAIVRRLSAVEALGGVTVIATDKTGTLTKNEMEVREFKFAPESDGKNDEELQGLALTIGALCNNAMRTPDGYVGDPTEIALRKAIDKYDIDFDTLNEEFPRIDEVPFDSETKYMITAHRSPEGKVVGFLKGAPAKVLELCDSYFVAPTELRPMDDRARKEFVEIDQEMAGRALRVLGLARSPSYEEGEKEGFQFVGFVGMIDPPREEAHQSIEAANEAGIRVIMLTGDQLLTAKAIAADVGFANPAAMHAHDLAGADKDRLAKIAEETNVFARVSPEDKLRLVEALQGAGHIVAVTGDGVNDAPALKKSDIGVAMGKKGTEVAREASDIVLADDNFATIVNAVEGGRTISTNILKTVHFLFSCNLAEVVVVFFATLVGLPLPLFPLAILWVNIVTDVAPAFALALEPAEPDVMKRPPAPAEDALISPRFARAVVWQSLVMAASVLAAYGWALQRFGEGSQARTAALLALVGVQVGQLFNARFLERSSLAGLRKSWHLMFAASAAILLQLLAVAVPLISDVLGVSWPRPEVLLAAVLAAVLPVLVVEAVKFNFARNGTADN